MPANISYNLPASETTLFESRAAAEAFFGGMQVPDAGLTSFGSVKKAASVSYTVISAYDEEDEFIAMSFGGVEEQIPRKIALDEVRTKLQTLSEKFDALLITLRNAGSLNS